jgi:hypothetical protein
LPRFADVNAWPECRMTAHPLASLDPKNAGEVLRETFYRAAGAEALFRAFLAERDHDRLGAWFWTEAYWRIVKIDNSEQR